MKINTREFIELVLLREKYISEGKRFDFLKFEEEKYKKYCRYLSVLYNQIY
jgi:hypothetical protein